VRRRPTTQSQREGREERVTRTVNVRVRYPTALKVRYAITVHDRCALFGEGHGQRASFHLAPQSFSDRTGIDPAWVYLNAGVESLLSLQMVRGGCGEISPSET
jgi:hypothetical protein